MHDPFFSIIMPTYNRADRIASTIKSVLRQRFPFWELIIVDDGSKDETKQIIADINDTRLRYFWKENEERSIARNYGIERSNGKVITFLDSDDLMLKDHLSTAYRLFSANQDTKILHLGYSFSDSYGRRRKRVILPEQEKIVDMLLWENKLSMNAMFVDSSLFQRVRFPNHKDAIIAEDWCLWLRLSALAPIKLHRKKTSLVVCHDERSLTTIDPIRYERSALCVLDDLQSDIALKRFLGAKKYKFLIAYFKLSIGQHHLIGQTKNLRQAMPYIFGAILTSYKVVFTRRFLASGKHAILHLMTMAASDYH